MSVTQVQTTAITDDAVTSIKIPDGAIGTTEISDGAVTAAKIATGAVGTTEIANDAVTAAKIATGAVGTTEIAAGAVSPEKLSNPLTLETAKNATGSAVNFPGIPSWVKRITVMFDGVSTNGSSIPIIQLGDSGGIETTSYSGQGDSFTQSSGALLIVNSTAHTVGFNLAANGIYIGSGFLRGIATIINFNSNTWVISSYASQASGASAAATGTKTLSGTLDRIRITTVNGTDTFDAGSINIMYE
jgi:hypothetical protein